MLFLVTAVDEENNCILCFESLFKVIDYGGSVCETNYLALKILGNGK
jgi:hypothetical protein